jgi:hypothetical protein
LQLVLLQELLLLIKIRLIDTEKARGEKFSLSLAKGRQRKARKSFPMAVAKNEKLIIPPGTFLASF